MNNSLVNLAFSALLLAFIPYAICFYDRLSAEKFISPTIEYMNLRHFTIRKFIFYNMHENLSFPARLLAEIPNQCFTCASRALFATPISITSPVETASDKINFADNVSTYF